MMTRHNYNNPVMWFTGLSGSGKSTLAQAVQNRLSSMGHHSIVLDGDVVRQGLCSDLGYSREDRKENIRRISEAAKLLADSGLILLIATISPFQSGREQAKAIIDSSRFLEIYCRCTISICRERDVKGLYRQALAGEISEFTGISAPYEEPTDPGLILDTATLDLEQCVQLVIGAAGIEDHRQYLPATIAIAPTAGQA